LTASKSSEYISPLGAPPNPLLIVVSGLSGVGKDTILNRLRQSAYPMEFIVTVTTRPPRPNERDGIHYRFVSESTFHEMIDSDGLLEYASVYGYYYGVPADPVRKALADEKDVVIKVDVQGAATIKKIVPEGILIFITASSMEELESRLKQRSTESESDLAVRLETAAAELDQLPLFDYVVINRRGDLNRAVADIESIITAEKCRVTPRKIHF